LCVNEDPIPADRIAPWLFTVCRNLAIDILRKEKRKVASEREEATSRQNEGRSSGDVVDLRKDSRTAISLFSTLAENEREVLRLKFQHDLNYREISEVTKLSVGYVGYLIHMGLKKVRQQMEQRPRVLAGGKGVAQ
jgi:RNA polymerase sigma-70 factor (ECF subfamily)